MWFECLSLESDSMELMEFWHFFEVANIPCRGIPYSCILEAHGDSEL